MKESSVTLTLTPIQAKVLWNVVDGAADAGACKDGNTKEETRALESISIKLLKCRESWKHIRLAAG